MADVYEYGHTVDVPQKSLDPLAHITLSRFNAAVMWQSQERLGDKSLREVLKDCYDQYNGILSCHDRETADALGVDAYVNLTAMKCGLVQSYMLESLVQSGALPWTIEPTPLPDLSDSGRMEVLEQIYAEVAGGFRGDLNELVRSLKTAAMRKQYETAKLAAENMEKLISDQCLEGGWNNAMYGLATDFTVYPFAVLQGPVPVRKPRLQWTGDRLSPKYEIYYEFTSISPFDFWYSPDSPDTQRGTGVFVRQRWTRQKLFDAMKLNSYISDNIKKVLEDAEQKEFNYKWLSERNPDQPDENNLVYWRNCSITVDVLVHYGFFSGSELKEYGITGLDDLEFYNAQVTVIDGLTVQVAINKNPNLNARPVYTASFYKTHDRIPSYAIPQRIRDVERCYLTVLRYLITNAAGSSGPIVEADYDRLSKYMTDDDIAKLIPNTIYLADGDRVSNNPAFKFYSIPGNMPGYMQVLEYFMNLVDKISNIPAALHGVAQGSGVNRTFRGAAMLQGNAVKAIQAAVSNIDHGIFGPLGQHLYNYNMVYSTDESVKGDCKILASGATGLLQREIDRQNSYEILQLTASAGQQLAQMPNGMKIMEWALSNVLKNMGVPKELLSGGATAAAAAGDPGGGMPANALNMAQAPAQGAEMAAALGTQLPPTGNM